MRLPRTTWKAPIVTTTIPRHRRHTALAVVSVLALIFSVAFAVAQQKPQSSSTPPRVEKDLLGEKEIPGDVFYGVQTARALENFQISGITINHYPEFVDALVLVKLAASQVARVTTNV